MVEDMIVHVDIKLYLHVELLAVFCALDLARPGKEILFGFTASTIEIIQDVFMKQLYTILENFCVCF